MNYKIIINADNGGDDSGIIANGITEKDYNLKISNYIHERLDKLGITNSIVRSTDESLPDEERVNRIKNIYGTGNNVIIISNSINSSDSSGAEIIYPLRNSSTLAKTISNQLESAGLTVNKYYQKRSTLDTSKDSNYLIRNTPNNQTIIIEYGNLNNSENATSIKNNWKEFAEAVVVAITNYINVEYIPTENSKYYVVVSGDSLYKIANKFGVSVDEIKSLNNLSSNLLSIGQVLLIPSESQTYTTYTVVSGDSLYKITNKFGVTVDEIKSSNNLSSNLLSIGQVLLIPSETQKQNYTKYSVVSGDSLYKIANKFGVSVDEIKSLNNLSSNLLSIGQVLLIPSESQTYTTYTVVSGDSLYKIANKFGVSVDEIKSLNNLSSNLLSIGQVLLIPSESQTYTTYTVVSGDSLYKIANKFGVSVDEIKSLNNLSSNLLSIGQKLKILK